MYMYYLLGYKLYQNPSFKKKEEKEKDIEAANTFILTLDGDIDFVPDAVIKLAETLGYIR